MEDEVRLLREQNALLQQQLQKQGSALDALKDKVQKLETNAEAQAVAAGENPPPASAGYNIGNIHFSAEGGVAFFNTGTEGSTPHSEFRVDEARVFVEAPVWDDIYFYSDVDLATRETTGLNTQLGELYLDFEDVTKVFGKSSSWLNIKAGRLDTPFGEEYQTRYAMENPLISHSLTDIWGIDPGVELYGKLGKFSYVLAVQNGGGNGVRDYDGDKSVMARVSYDPNKTWHFSLSGMRTGNLDPKNDYTSALWFGNGWFTSIGSPATTKFHAEAVEGDITGRWKSGHVSAFGGYVRYGDNDPAADNSRNIFYYSVEAEQDLPHKFYLASRFSQILAPDGYPLVGFGDMANYFGGTLTTSLWRFTLGGGYRFSDRLAVKVEYSLEQGTEVGGAARSHEDFFGTEAVFKF
ncbi:MAG TPA: outer membrane beta-barrel protein [Verrucomicrobiae bacterium]|nr:outer membrane beta-barrel protein [Verrucomicrobiae bacterium]